MADTITLELDNGLSIDAASAHGSRMIKAMPVARDMGKWFQTCAAYTDCIYEARKFIDANGGIGVIARNDEVIEHNVPLPTPRPDERQIALF